MPALTYCRHHARQKPWRDGLASAMLPYPHSGCSPVRVRNLRFWSIAARWRSLLGRYGDGYGFNPNRSLDRNVLISIVILLLLAVLCPSAAVFSSVSSRRSPLRLLQNGRKTVCHKYIIRLSSNDRFGFKRRLFSLQYVAFRIVKGNLLRYKRIPFATLSWASENRKEKPPKCNKP